MKVKILMVCLGNICRSPLAEGILQSKLNSEKFQVDSCGTSNYHIGAQPDIRSIETARQHGINISNQKAAQFKPSDFDTYDFIYPMDSSNYHSIIDLATDQQDTSKVKLILDELTPNQGIEVPDPYYGGKEGFENVYQMLNEACNIIASKLQSPEHT